MRNWYRKKRRRVRAWLASKGIITLKRNKGYVFHFDPRKPP